MSYWIKANPEIRRLIKRFLSPDQRRLILHFITSPTRLPYYFAAKGIHLSDNHHRILDLKNTHNDKRCFIIGSGPSINKIDLSKLKDEITFGFNAFYLIQEEVGFLPTYYLVEDPLPAEDNADVLNNIKGTTKIFPSDLRYCLYPDPNTIYVNFVRFYANYPDPDFPRFSPNALRCVYWGGTVAYMALQLAYYMGISEVYLIGIDLDYKIPEHATEDIIKSREEDISHFHPDYFGPGKRWHLPKVERMAKSFEYGANIFSDHGRKVYNATLGGQLNTITRISYQDVISQ